MLLRTLRFLFVRQSEKTHESTVEQVSRLLKEKHPEQAKEVLEHLINSAEPQPDLLALKGEVEFHLKNHAEAEYLFLTALKHRPGLAKGHYGLSLVHYESGRHEEALAQAQYARNIDPNNPAILAQLGLCCIALRSYSQALDALRHSLLLDPDNVPALNNLGIVHHAMKEPNEALNIFQRALALQPDYGPARENLRCLFGIESFSTRFNAETNTLESEVESLRAQDVVFSDQAEKLEEQFELSPEDPAAAAELVRFYIKSLNLEAAHDVLQIAMAHNRLNAILLGLNGRLAHMVSNLKSARTFYEQALLIEPKSLELLHGLGHVLRDMDKHEDALRPFEQASEIEQSLNTLSQLAFAQVRACQYEEALLTCDKIETLFPQFAPMLQSSRAMSYAYLGHFDKALQYLEEADKTEHLNPGFASFRGIIHLMLENYAEGWDGYRYRAMAESQHMRLLPYPLWQGEYLQDKTILVLAEQGLGDQIMFASCLPDLLDRQPREVLLEANARVEKTLSRSFPQVKVFPSGQQSFDWLPQDMQPDFYVPIAELARYFRRSKEAFPEHEGYLVPDAQRLNFWKEKLQALNDKPKIGISWRGGVQQTRRSVRSLQLDALAPILGDERFQFVNLQYGNVGAELAEFSRTHPVTIANWREAIADLDEFAALITALDLVITVCNTTVHYAGSLGKPCWIMSPFVPEWRYGIASARMRWYPSTRMFRQKSMGDWEGVLSDVAVALDAYPLSQNNMQA